MLNGIYGLFFGNGEESNDSVTSSSSSEESGECSSLREKLCENDWYLIEGDENANSGRFSPVLVPNLEVRDIDELSFASTRGKGSPLNAVPSMEEIKRTEELRLAKARSAQKAKLEKLLFEDMSVSTLAAGTFKRTSTSSGMKRGAQASDSLKGKSRSKKSAGKLSSGRNNDRKCNNID